MSFIVLVFKQTLVIAVFNYKQYPSIFVANFEQVSHVALVFLLFTLKKFHTLCCCLFVNFEQIQHILLVSLMLILRKYKIF